MIDPVTGFVIVWTFLGSALTVLFRLMKMRNATGVAFFVALIPAAFAAMYLNQ